jgi:hypothetical protein
VVFAVQIEDQTKVSQFARFLLGNQYVVQLNVQMDEVAVVQTLQRQQQVQQTGPHHPFRYRLGLRHIIFQTTLAQLHLHVQAVILLPRLVQRHTMLVLRELFDSFHLLQPLGPIAVGAQKSLRLFDRIVLAVLFAERFEHLAKTALANFGDLLEALLEVGLLLQLIVDGTEQGRAMHRIGFTAKRDRLGTGRVEAAIDADVMLWIESWWAGILVTWLGGNKEETIIAPSKVLRL